jgi:hypothetical protein
MNGIRIWYIGGIILTGKKPQYLDIVLLCPPQIPQGLLRD